MSQPSTESQVACALIRNAAELAERGQLAAGYTLVWSGLQWARGLAETGAPNATEAVRQWEQELEHYCRRFGVSLVSPGQR